jgi:transposase
VVRFPTKANFASYSGTAPVEASSGEVVRHRLSLAGNRKLNNALHMVAICQARSDVRGRSYYRKKIAEGKSCKEALRCLERRISDAVLQEPYGRFAGAFAQRRLTKRSRERLPIFSLYRLGE